MSASVAGSPPWLGPGPRPGCAVLRLHVQPGAARTELAGAHGDRLRVRLAAPPVDGAANRLLLEFLAERLALPRRNLVLLRGATGRRKDVQVQDAGPERLAALGGPA